jgi:hypothetical protein
MAHEIHLYKESAPTGFLAGASIEFSGFALLSAHLHRLALSDVGEKSNFARTVNLQGKGALMLCAQTRCSLGKNLAQTVHELLQLCGPLIVERELLLTDSAFSLSTMKHT